MSINRPSLRTLADKQNLVGCEIGVGGGLNAYNILENLDIEMLYLIDPWLHHKGKPSYMKVRANNYEEEAMLLIKSYCPKVIIIRLLSIDAAKYIGVPLDFVYIDGSHHPKWVREDLNLYYPLVKQGGLVAGHDYNHSCNLYRVVDAFAKELGVKVHSGVCDDSSVHDWWFFKKEEYNGRGNEA